MQIWIYLNGIQQGPYTLEQIRVLNIDPSTPVWYNGLDEWTPAAKAPAVASLFDSQPADAPRVDTREGSKPPTFLVWNILLTILCCCPTALAGIITGALSSSRFASGDYEGAKRMSTATEWLLIISIVWMILSMPLSIIWGVLG